MNDKLSYGSEMVQIPVSGGEFGKISLLEGGAIQLPETAQFFPHGTAGRCRLPETAVSDGKVNEFLEAGKCTLGAALFPGLQCLQDTGSLAADVGHLLRESEFGPTAVFQRRVLHLCCNEFIDNGFNGGPNLRILHVS